ncbi:MAG: acetolactate synthase [Rhizobiales bacterium 65-9]|nr:MAG: acetolactate synthase [Rhizobiales bacterium 65-9]
MKVHVAIAQVLKDLGVDTLFGLIGDANLYMVDSYRRDAGGRFVPVANEASSVLAALGYAQVSGKVGVATVTHGPALTNTLTALVEGVKSGVAIVLLAGDTPVEDRDHLQTVNQREFIMATGAGFEQLRAPHTCADDIARAFRRASLERRPIVLNMPIEFQWLDVDYQKPVIFLPEDRAVVPSSSDLDDAAGIIASAKRPLVLAGRGATAPEARAALIRLARRIDAPLATTLRASGLFHGESFDLGVFGTLSTDVATDVIGEADCIVAFGAGLNRFTTAMGSLVKGKRVVQVNLERAEVGKNLLPDAGLVGDPALTAETIVRLLDEAEVPPSGFRDDAMRDKIAAYRMAPRLSGVPRPGTVDIRTALLRFNEVIPADRVLVTDAGRFLYEAWHVMRVRDPRAFVYTVGYGAIGLGVGEAIGAAEAASGTPTVLLTGDGGFMLGGLTELNSAVRAQQDLIIILCNDGGYGAEHIQFRNKNMDPALSLFRWPDFAPVAEALGARGVTVRTREDLDAAAVAVVERDRKRPLLIDLRLDPDHVPVH